MIFTQRAAEQLAAITDLRVRQLISEQISSLAENPLRQGKPLWGDLAGYRSIRAAGQRYRIIYSANANIVTASIVTIGRRRAGSRDDVYALAQRLARLGRLAPPPAEGNTDPRNQE
jgi:mRNA interferase RelE/StbE